MATDTHTDLAFAGLAGQADLVRRGEASPRELVELALTRIERLDPRLNAFRCVRAERALEEAASPPPGPLSGVPVAVKDNVDVTGELTSHGTGAVTRRAATDAEAVRRLRAAGAVIVGKTHMPELAMWAHFTESQTHGATRNPWNPDRSAGGSSGGSAVAVAAGPVGGGVGSPGGGGGRVAPPHPGGFWGPPPRGPRPPPP